MKALPTVRAAALLAEPEKRRSLANRGERRTAQRGGHPSHWWVSVTRHRREQTSLAIRCAIRIRKYGANNTNACWDHGFTRIVIRQTPTTINRR